MVTEVLNSLGLSIEESEIYSTLLDKGQLSASEIAKNSKVKRTYVYAVCKSLIKKGLIQQLTEKNITKFAPLSPDHLMDLAERQKQEALKASQTLEGILPTLKNKFGTIESKPVITYYEGVEGIKKIYKDTLNDRNEMHSLVETSSVNEDVYKWLTSEYVKERVKRNIKVKAIVASGQNTKIYTSLDKNELRETKVINRDKFPFENEINIYGNKVAIVSYKKNSKLLGIIIDNPLLAKTFKSWFKLTWSSIS